jgi:hypothetical protein
MAGRSRRATRDARFRKTSIVRRSFALAANAMRRHQLLLTAVPVVLVLSGSEKLRSQGAVSAHRRGRDRVMTTRSIRWIGPLGAIVELVALAPAAEAATTARAKPKCVWPGRDCHPPARLWYRVSASLKAEQC